MSMSFLTTYMVLIYALEIRCPVPLEQRIWYCVHINPIQSQFLSIHPSKHVV